MKPCNQEFSPNLIIAYLKIYIQLLHLHMSVATRGSGMSSGRRGEGGTGVIQLSRFPG